MPHQPSPVFTFRTAVDPKAFQALPRESTVQRFRSLKEPDLQPRHIAALQRGGINGNEARSLARIFLHKALGDISSHRLPDQDRTGDPLPFQDLMQPHRLIHQRKIKPEGTGGCVSRRVPCEQIVFPV